MPPRKKTKKKKSAAATKKASKKVVASSKTAAAAATATTTTAIPWAGGFCLPTEAERAAAAGSFPLMLADGDRPAAAAATTTTTSVLQQQHRRRHLGESSLHGARHAGQTDRAALFAPPVGKLPALRDDQDWLAQVAEPGQTFDQYVRDDLSLRSGRWTSRTGTARTGGVLLVPIEVSLGSSSTSSSDSSHPSKKNDESSSSLLLEELRRYLFAFLGESVPVQLSEPAYLSSDSDTPVEWREGSSSGPWCTTLEWIPPPRGGRSSCPHRMVTARHHESPDRVAVDVNSVLACLTDLTSVTAATTTTSTAAAGGGGDEENSQQQLPHSVVGVLTSTDLYSAGADLFIAGLSAGGSRVAAFSLHRYHPHLRMSPVHWWKYGYARRANNAYSYFEEDDYESVEIKDDGAATTAAAAAATKKAPATSSRKRPRSTTLRLASTPPATLSPRSRREFLTRAAKLFSHEVLHLLLVGHCIYHACLMNGTAHLVEDFAAPPHLCGVDLRKLQFRLGFDVARRYTTPWRRSGATGAARRTPSGAAGRRGSAASPRCRRRKKRRRACARSKSFDP